MTDKRLMEVFVLVLVLLAIVLGLQVLFPEKAEAEPVDTYHSGWHLVRDTAGEDAATFAAALDLAGSEGDFANKPSGAFRIPATDNKTIIPGQSISPGVAWIFALCGTDTANDTFSFTMVGWADGNGMAQVMAHGDCILGTQDVVLYPHDSSTATSAFWSDTNNLDALDLWPSINEYNNANNEVGIIAVDLTGLEYVQFFIYEADGTTGVEAVNVTVYGRRY
ncbi:MAG: hypothetical protein V3W44_04275 [Dehalococcoidales bacterium]